MGSIPLPALQIKAPQAPDLLGDANKLLSFKAMQQQQQLGQQEQQLNSQKLQEGQIALADSKATSDAMREWDGKNLDDLPGIVQKKGGSANAVLGLKKSIIEQKKATADLAKSDSDAVKAKLDQQAATNDYLAQQIESFKGTVANTDAPVDPAAAAQQFEQIKQKAIADGHLDAKAAAGIQLDPSKPIGPQLDMIENNLLGHAKVVAALKDHADIAEKEAATAKSKAETKALEEGGTQATADARYRKIKLAEALKKPLSDEDKAFVTAYEKQKTLNATTTFNLQNAGATGTAGQPSTLAKGLADGSLKWQDVVSVRTPMSVKSALLAEVRGLKPDYNSGDRDVEQAVKKQATSGQVGQQLLAIGTAREHMKLFRQLADALDNGDVQALNKIGNEIGVQFGSDKKTNFDLAAKAFGGEVGRAFDGAGVTAGERESAEKSYADFLSKGQFKGAADTVDALLAGKQKAAHDWFDQGVQAKPDFGQGAATKQSTGHKVGDVIVQNGKKFKAKAVDKDGKVTDADPL